jgi:hypothetical protein
MLDNLLPDWSKRAACAEQAPNRAPLAIMFDDDLAYQPKGPGAYTWPAGVLQAMKMCAGCPVRTQCLDYAFEIEKRESRDWWTNELVQNDRRFGILGGVPGRIREWFADTPNPEAACDDWFRRFAAKKRWMMDERKGREVA